MGEGITIIRCNIPHLLKAPDFIDALNLWVDYKAFGAPVTGGYLEWPCQLYDIFKTFDSLHPKYQVKND